MNEEIEAAKGNFPNGEIPTNILFFYDFITNNKLEGFLDYETIIDCKRYLEDAIKADVLNEFVPFFVDSSHSCYSIWVNDNLKPIDQLPIMYSDTEGLYMICALNLNDFFVLLSKNLIRKFCSVWNNYLLGYSSKKPEKRFSEDILNEYNEYNELNYGDFIAFRSFVNKKMKINSTENVIEIMSKAVEKYPNIVEYIRSKDGFIIDPEK